VLYTVGVVNGIGDRKVLGITVNDTHNTLENKESNSIALETKIFCAKYNITTVEACDGVSIV
jgi:hypothetical protein